MATDPFDGVKRPTYGSGIEISQSIYIELIWLTYKESYAIGGADPSVNKSLNNKAFKKDADKFVKELEYKKNETLPNTANISRRLQINKDLFDPSHKRSIKQLMNSVNLNSDNYTPYAIKSGLLSRVTEDFIPLTQQRFVAVPKALDNQISIGQIATLITGNTSLKGRFDWDLFEPTNGPDIPPAPAPSVPTPVPIVPADITITGPEDQIANNGAATFSVDIDYSGSYDLALQWQILGASVDSWQYDLASQYLNNPWSQIIETGGKLIAISTSTGTLGTQLLMYSDDAGITWNISNLPRRGYWSDIAYGNGAFIIVGSPNGAVVDFVLTSTDGVNWNISNIGVTGDWHRVAYGNGIFLAISRSSGLVIRSVDEGKSWSSTRLSNRFLSDITFGPDLFGRNCFIIVTSNGKAVFKSIDGISWSKYDMPTRAEWHRVIHTGGSFIAITNANNISARSLDGEIWTRHSLPALAFWSALATSNGRCIAICDGANIENTQVSLAVSDDDGITWYPAYLNQAYPLTACTSTKSRFILLGQGALIISGQEWINIRNQTNTQLTLQGLTEKDNDNAYRVIINAVDIETQSSNVANLTVKEQTVIRIIESPTDQYVISEAVFKVNASTSTATTPRYQWQEILINDEWIDLPEETQEELILSNLTSAFDNERMFRAKITAGEVVKYTRQVTLYVLFMSIVSEPSDQTAINGNAQFSVSVNTNSIEPLTYQWQRNVSGTWENIGENSSTLTLSTITYDLNNSSYRVIINLSGLTPIVSDTASLAVPLPTIDEIVAPTDLSVSTVNAQLTTTATVSSGEQPQIQWQQNTNDGSGWIDIDGATSNTLILSDINTNIDNTQYRALVGAIGIEPIASDPATLTVIPSINLPVLIDQTGRDIAVFAIGPSTTSVEPIIYQWQSSKDKINWTVLDGESSSILTLDNLLDNFDPYYRTVVSTTDFRTGEEITAITNVATLNVEKYLEISRQPLDYTSTDGTAFFDVVASTNSVSNIEYQWESYVELGSWGKVAELSNRAIAYGNNLYVALVSSSNVRVANQLTDITNGSYKSITLPQIGRIRTYYYTLLYAADRFIAVGNTGVSTSTNGINWSVYPYPGFIANTAMQMIGISTGEPIIRFFLLLSRIENSLRTAMYVNYSGTFIDYFEGWSAISLPPLSTSRSYNGWQNIATDGDASIVIVGNEGSIVGGTISRGGTGTIAALSVQTDGPGWEFDPEWVAYGADRFVIVGTLQSSNQYYIAIAYSALGGISNVSFFNYVTPPELNEHLNTYTSSYYRLFYARGQFILSGRAGYFEPKEGLYYSTDGINWTHEFYPTEFESGDFIIDILETPDGVIVITFNGLIWSLSDGWTQIDGAISNELIKDDLDFADSGSLYRVSVNLPDTTPLISEVATLQVAAIVDGSISFTTQPIDANIEDNFLTGSTNNVVEFTSAASHSGGRAVTYQWQKAVGIQDNWIDIIGATNSRLNIGYSQGDSGTRYRVIASVRGSLQTTSNVAELTGRTLLILWGGTIDGNQPVYTYAEGPYPRIIRERNLLVVNYQDGLRTYYADETSRLSSFGSRILQIMLVYNGVPYYSPEKSYYDTPFSGKVFYDGNTFVFHDTNTTQSAEPLPSGTYAISIKIAMYDQIMGLKTSVFYSTNTVEVNGIG